MDQQQLKNLRLTIIALALVLLAIICSNVRGARYRHLHTRQSHNVIK